jgi:hypothetical protein
MDKNHIFVLYVGNGVQEWEQIFALARAALVRALRRFLFQRKASKAQPSYAVSVPWYYPRGGSLVLRLPRVIDERPRGLPLRRRFPSTGTDPAARRRLRNGAASPAPSIPRGSATPRTPLAALFFENFAMLEDRLRCPRCGSRYVRGVVRSATQPSRQALGNA